MLLHVPGILDANEVAYFREQLSTAEWVDGRETVGSQGAKVKRNLQLPDNSPIKADLGRRVLAALRRNPVYFAAALPIRTVPPRFNCYQGGGTYGLHVDGSVMIVDSETEGTTHVRSDISCTLFLNEPQDYEGGELTIVDTYGEHEVKLPAGDIILYPSSSLHQVQPVTKGARIASFFWIQSMIRDESQRRLLFEMDTAIQTLTNTGADSQATLKMTGVYHNLLRQWSEV